MSQVMAMARPRTYPTALPQEIPGDRAAKLTEEAEAYLAQATRLFSVVRTDYRRIGLEVGRLLTRHVEILVQAGQLDRTQIVKTAAARLRVKPERVHELIKVALAVELLAKPGADLGLVSYSSLSVFANLVDVPLGNLKKGVDPAAGREAFARAVEEGWGLQQVRKAVWGMVGKRRFNNRITYVDGIPTVAHGEDLSWVRSGPDGDVQEVPTSQLPQFRAAQTVSAIAVSGTVKDVASMLLEVVRHSLCPRELARLVAEGLQRAVDTAPGGPDGRDRKVVDWRRE